MVKQAILAVDSGTTAAKAAIVSMTGAILGLGRAPIATRFGRAGRAQQDPVEILSAQRRAIREAISLAGRVEIAGAGITSQRSTFVIWDSSTGRCIGPAPTWQDTSAADVCLNLRRQSGLVRRLTGLPLSPHYSASKIARTLRAGRVASRVKTRLLFGSVATWLLWNLTNEQVHATDPTHAARSLLMNLSTLSWDERLLSMFEVPRAILPTIRPGIGSFGTIRSGAGRRVPVTACLGDQQAALFALGGPTTTLVNYGTGAFVLTPVHGRPARSAGLLSSIGWTSASERHYLVEGTVNAAGSTLDWLRRELGVPQRLDAIEALCRKAKGHCVMIPGGRLGSMQSDRGGAALPGLILDADSDGMVASLTRAAVESIAFMVDEIVSSTAPAGRAGRVVLTGPLSGLPYLEAFQAATLAPRRVEVSEAREATLLGIARAAAMGLGGEYELAASRWRSPARHVKAPAAMRREAVARRGRWRLMVRMARRMAGDS